MYRIYDLQTESFRKDKYNSPEEAYECFGEFLVNERNENQEELQDNREWEYCLEDYKELFKLYEYKIVKIEKSIKNDKTSSLEFDFVR